KLGRKLMVLSVEDVMAALDAIRAGAIADRVESRRLDFKRQGRSREDTVRDLAAAAACFANADGGTLVVGVRDRVPGVAAIEGTDLDPVQVARRVYELTQPPLTVDTEFTTYAGKRLLLVAVPRSVEIHQVEGRATHRVGTSCEPMTATQIANAVGERRGEDWSAADTDVPLGAVSAIAMEVARRLLLRQSLDPQRRGYANETDTDLLRVMGVVSSRGTLLRAGYLLLCATEGTHDQVLVYQFRRTPAGEPTDVHRLPGPLLLAVTRVLELVDARVDKTPVNLPNGQQISFSDLPEPAVREAVINAVIHRDHRLPDPVRVEHAPSRLVVTSPGPLVAGVTVDNILSTSSRPRNTRLTRAVRILGLAEEAGVGVDRMYREMVRVGHQPPQFAEEADRVRVTLLGGAPNQHLTRYVATLPAAEADDADPMLILYQLLTKRTVTASSATRLLQKGVAEVEDVLRRLASETVAMIEPTRESFRRRHPNYRLQEHVVSALGPAVSYRRRTTDEYDRKIIELVREVGQINARMVKIALDLDTAPASRALGDLVSRGVLVKTSEAQRGPAVTYGPGEKFPQKRTRSARRG
ncbi:MAG TPA: ATP-binding protein, partial [Micromonosporaceae bacterium]